MLHAEKRSSSHVYDLVNAVYTIFISNQQALTSMDYVQFVRYLRPSHHTLSSTMYWQNLFCCPGSLQKNKTPSSHIAQHVNPQHHSIISTQRNIAVPIGIIVILILDLKIRKWHSIQIKNNLKISVKLCWLVCGGCKLTQPVYTFAEVVVKIKVVKFFWESVYWSNDCVGCTVQQCITVTKTAWRECLHYNLAKWSLGDGAWLM